MSKVESKAHAAAMELTLAAIAKIDFRNATNSTVASTQGKDAAELINNLYNKILANLEHKP